jgi:Na+/H+ antiporter NhaA
MVAGVGFTMSLFIAQLAFTEPHLLAAAKVGVLVASGLAGILALVFGRLLLTPEPASATLVRHAPAGEGERPRGEMSQPR